MGRQVQKSYEMDGVDEVSDLWHSSIYRRAKSNEQAIDLYWSSRSIYQVLAATLHQDFEMRATC